jgi:hypothetical protein
VSPTLRKRVSRHPKLKVTLTVTDAGGRAFTLTRQVRAG